MTDKIIKIKKLPSGITVIVTETASDTIGLEIGSGVISMAIEDLYDFIRLSKEVDEYFLKR